MLLLINTIRFLNWTFKISLFIKLYFYRSYTYVKLWLITEDKDSFQCVALSVNVRAVCIVSNKNTRSEKKTLILLLEHWALASRITGRNSWSYALVLYLIWMITLSLSNQHLCAFCTFTADLWFFFFVSKRPEAEGFGSLGTFMNFKIKWTCRQGFSQYKKNILYLNKIILNNATSDLY